MDRGNHAQAPLEGPVISTTFSVVAALALAAVALALGAVGDVSLVAALAVVGGCAVLALVPAAIARHDRTAVRARADRLLRLGVRVHPASALLTWREAELTSERERRALARSLRHIVRELEGRLLPGAVPLNRVAARPHTELIALLSERLAATDEPVSAHGVALVERLLTDGFESPLYVRERAGGLGAELERCLVALEPGSRSEARV